ncbi:protein hsr-9 [Folsomia candida]|uniref:protein hsr-9 n=1 Tax=Folsomia candida TaxID=158441 RepID=UPI000B8FFED6|nr:protein hsr-9 [Folsomia candida]
MEDTKTTDKRKAPDKNTSSDLDDSLSIEQQPLKRPRMDDPTVFEEDFEILEQTGVEAVSGEGEVNRVDTAISTSDGDSNQVISQPDDEGLVVSTPAGLNDTAIALDISESMSIEPSSLALEDGSKIGDKEQLLEHIDKGYANEVEIADEADGDGDKDDDDDNNNGVPEARDILKFTSNDLGMEGENLIPSETNGGHEAHKEGGKKEKTSPKMTSSPLSADSAKVDLPSREINICLKAFDPKTGKLVFEEPCIRSDYIKLEVFLNQHNLGLTNSSFNSGYVGDVESEDIFSFPGNSYKNRKSRYTSSTLGSSIPRASIKTVFSNSPNDNDSPKEDDEEEPPKSKKRGKNEPKMTSTRLSDITDEYKFSAGKKEKHEKLDKLLSLSNGTTTSNGFETPNSNTKATKRGLISTSKSPSIKSSTVVSPSTGDKSKKKTTKATPKQLQGKELERISNSSHTVEPSPCRAVAIVEGTAARPLTKFEQDVNNEPVDEKLLKHSKTLWGSVAKCEPVFARWSDKNYYSGCIREKGMNDTWIIDFDDATTYPASEGHIIPIKILGVGIKGVYCPDTGYHPADAVILGQKFGTDPEIGETVKYAIKITKGEDVGKLLWCSRRMLSIKENDARGLRQEFQPTPKVLKAAEVSLENIIPQSSRRRVTVSSIKSSLTPQSTKKRVVGGAFDASITGDESKHTPQRKTPKIKPKKKIIETTSSLSGNSKSFSRSNSLALSSTNLSSSSTEKSLKESPKKTKLKDKSPEHLVFAGCQFFLTASGGGDPASLGSNLGSQVPYDKDEYRDLIEKKGGKIVDVVGAENDTESIFLVSDNFARTVKYIYSLAASIPCVSHKWVQECISQGKIVPWESYELNAGWSLESNKVIPPHKKKPLKGFEIYITAGSNDLYDYWKPVLTAAHATLLKPKKGKGKAAGSIPKDAQVLVTDATCSSEILAEAHDRMIPVVKPEWLVQSIIAGERADFFNHEKYRVEVLTEETEDSYDDEDDDEDENEQS